MKNAHRALVVGNWKMNLDHVEAVHLSQQLVTILKNQNPQHTDVAVAPPFTDVRSVTSVFEAEKTSVSVYAQHVHPADAGAFTGEVSVGMLRRLNVASVLVGHSERRTLFGMTDDIVNATAKSATSNGLGIVLCVGESLVQRDDETYVAFIENQITSALNGIPVKYDDQIVIAYEPIWAIGTGRTASSEQVAEIMDAIRRCLKESGRSSLRVLYGGSVTSENSAELIENGRVDGFLVGGASLKAENFAQIVQSCDDCYDKQR